MDIELSNETYGNLNQIVSIYIRMESNQSRVKNPTSPFHDGLVGNSSHLKTKPYLS